MLSFVFFMLLTVCSAKLGYEYGTPNVEQNELPVSNHYDAHADFHKYYYGFEAPQDAHEESERVARKIAASAQKHLQVVFIKAPQDKALESAVHALTQQAGDDKTAIYVLNKQTDTDELAQQLTNLRAQPKHKPIVNFVKYKTEEEAKHAQKLIQASYATTGQAAKAQPQLPELPLLNYLPAEQPQSSHLPAEPAIPLSSYLPTQSVSSAVPMTPALSTELPVTPVLPPTPSLAEQSTEHFKASYLQMLTALQELQAAHALSASPQKSSYTQPASPPNLSYLPAQSAISTLSSKESRLQALAALLKLPEYEAFPPLPELPEYAAKASYLAATPQKSSYLPAQPAISALPSKASQVQTLAALQEQPEYAALPEQPASQAIAALPELPVQPLKLNYFQALTSMQGSAVLLPKPSYGPDLPELPPKRSYKQTLPEETQSNYMPSLTFLPTIRPTTSYLPQLPNYATAAASYQTGLIDLPEQSQQPASPYNSDVYARAAPTNRVDFRMNERQRRGSRILFPSDDVDTRSASDYLPAVQFANRRSRHASH